jgi:surface antigen
MLSHLLPRAATALVVATAAAALPAGAATAAPHSHHAKPHHTRPHHTRPHRTVHVGVRLGVNAGGRGGDPGDDYPAQWKNARQDSVLDNWREYNRECTSFAAWALASRNGFNMPFHANAKDWGPKARAAGYADAGTPAPGSVAWSSAGTWGHVAYVVAVNGASVSIEEYNHLGDGRYTARTVPASTFTGYIHFADTQPATQPTSPVQPGPVQTAPAGPIQGGSSTAIQGGSGTAIQGGSSTPIQGGSPATPVQGPGGGSGQATVPQPPAVFAEQQGHHGVNTLTNPFNASGMGPRVDPGQTVQVSCRVYAPQIASANPDGWWYRIHQSPWNDQYYSPANTFMNGDPWSGPYTHNTDFAVPVC